MSINNPTDPIKSTSSPIFQPQIRFSAGLFPPRGVAEILVTPQQSLLFGVVPQDNKISLEGRHYLDHSNQHNGTFVSLRGSTRKHIGFSFGFRTVSDWGICTTNVGCYLNAHDKIIKPTYGMTWEL